MKRIIIVLVIGSLLNCSKSHCPKRHDPIYDIQKNENSKYHKRGYAHKVKHQQKKCNRKSYY